MAQLISFLLGLFSGTGSPISKFFNWLGKKVGFTAIILPLQFTFLGALLVAKAAYFTALVTLIVWIYNRLNDLLEMISNLENDNVLSLLFSFLNSIGFISALNQAFSYFSYVFVALLILFISRLAVHNLQSLSDEYYKIGMLIQSGLK